MTRRTCRLTGAASVARVMALFLVAALLLNGCGCQREPEPAPTVPSVEVAPKEEPVAGPSVGAVRPVTFEVLQLMPESAAVAMAIPSLTNVYDKGLAFAKRLVPDEVDLDAQVAEAVAELAGEMEVEGAESFADIVRAKGFDPGRPLALFIDVAPIAAGVKKVAKALEEPPDEGEESAPAEAEPEGSEAEETAPEGSESKESTGAESSGASDTAEAEAQANPFDALRGKPLGELAFSLQPAMACVVPCTDPALAEATLKEALNACPILTTDEVEDVEASGMTIHNYGSEVFSYFLSGDLLVAGNRLALVKEVAARFEEPAKIRYGTVECPAAAPDEIVELVRMDKVMSALENILPVFASLNPQMATMMTMQAKSIEDAVAAYGDSDDPSVVTMEWTEEKLEILGRTDFSTHPSLLTLSGEAAPLRLARLLPENTLVLIGVRLTPEAKAKMQEQWSGAVPSEMQESPQAAMSMGIAKSVTEMIGDEVAVGITGVQGGLPTAVAIVGLANVDQVKGLLMTFGLGAPGAGPAETYNGVEIWAVPFPLPTPIHYAFVKDTLVAANDLAQLKTVIDLLQSGGTTALFESLEPPLDPNVPRYGALLLKASLLTEVIVPVSGGVRGEAEPEAKAIADKVPEVFREVPMTQDVVNNWQESRMVVYLNAPSG